MPRTIKPAAELVRLTNDALRRSAADLARQLRSAGWVVTEVPPSGGTHPGVEITLRGPHSKMVFLTLTTMLPDAVAVDSLAVGNAAH